MVSSGVRCIRFIWCKPMTYNKEEQCVLGCMSIDMVKLHTTFEIAVLVRALRVFLVQIVAHFLEKCSLMPGSKTSNNCLVSNKNVYLLYLYHRWNQQIKGQCRVVVSSYDQCEKL